MEVSGDIKKAMTPRLYNENSRVNIVSPRRIKGYASSHPERTTTDAADSALIARLDLWTEAAIAEISSDEFIETLHITDSFPVKMAKENGFRTRRWLRGLPTRDVGPQRTPSFTESNYM
jgi:transposase